MAGPDFLTGGGCCWWGNVGGLLFLCWGGLGLFIIWLDKLTRFLRLSYSKRSLIGVIVSGYLSEVIVYGVSTNSSYMPTNGFA